MKNLNLLKSDVIKLDLDDSCNQFYLNRNSNNVYLLTTNGTATCINVENNTSENFHLSTSPIKLTYLSVTSEISIIDSKSIFIFDQNLNLNVSYNFTNECKIAEYSPGQDLLAVLTNDLKVKVLNIDSYGTFSIINEIKLDDYKYVNQFINVGWGSKETQFHGSEGKGARKILTIDNSDINEISVTNSNITWRGDGLLFAVSFIRGKDYAFLVLNKDGVPQYSSEFCSGLESPLCWKPSGNLIAGVQKLPNKYQIVFFEKNGLRHGEFTISDKAKVQKMSWSSDSEILCILYENNNIQLWTSSNYHWYLKQSLQFDQDIILSDLYWDTGFETKNGKIMYLLCNSSILIYEWIWNVNHSKGFDENDLACVAVIDGTEALITSFKKSSIPPPMSAVTLKTDKIINFVFFGPSDHANDLCVIFDDYSCNTYKCLERFEYELAQEFCFDCKNEIPLAQNHFLWIDINTFLSCSDRTIKKYVLSEQSSGVVDTKVFEVNDIVISMETVCTTKQVVFQLINGDIYTLDIENGSMTDLFRIPSACDIIKPCLIGDKTVIFGLDRFNRFYVGNNCMANTITSFFIHSEFLLLTTSKHVLICVHLNDNGLQMLHKNASNMFMRSIERGSKIIVAVQRGRKVILQMPRGNLETICPRIMSLQMITNLLDSNKYLEAFQIMKVERINLNILYDHNPKQFLENIDLFIKQIDDPTHLNMFLLELRDADVTQTMYSMCYAGKPNLVITDPNKKTLIADIFVKCLSTAENQKKFLLSIVTALIIKRNQTDLERALNIIYEMKLQDRILAEKALEHLLLLVPINELYNIALGTYNFDLIMFVVAKSQKDPKEYIPFLNQLNQLEENYKKYTIDKYLKRYPNALKWITKCDDKFTECLEFIKTHNLYKESLELFRGQTEKYAIVCEAYGNYLLEKRCFVEAGIMFERSTKFVEAIQSYKLGGQWSHCIRCAIKLNYNSVQLNKLYLSLTEDLVAQRQYKDASIIFIEHLNDPEMAIEVLTNGRLWSDCLRLSYAHNRLDMLETHIKPGILQHAEILESQIETNLNEFKMKIERLKIVKSLKKSELDDSNDQFIEDGLYSDTASVISKNSMTSKSSFRSFRSSKNKRKHERKLLSLKEGSKFEDIALIQFLHNLINNTFAMRQETYDLCTILMMFNEDTLARKLQNILENLLKLIKVSEKEIWSENLDTTNNFMFGPEATSNVASDIMNNDTLNGNNKNILEPQFRYPPQQTDVHWKLFTLN